MRDCDKVDLERSLYCSVDVKNIRLKPKACTVKIERRSLAKSIRTNKKMRRPLKEKFILAKKFKILSTHIEEGERKGA